MKELGRRTETPPPVKCTPAGGGLFHVGKEISGKVPQKSKTWEEVSILDRQEKYLKSVLDDGEVPMDNNRRAINPQILYQ